MTDAPVDLEYLAAKVHSRAMLTWGEMQSLISELRAARAPVAGVVTREHRDAAAAALYPMRDDRPELPLGVWVTTGNGNLGHEPVRVAQAIADAEARGASRATPPADPAVLGHIGSCAGCFFAELELLDALRDGAEAGEPAEKLLKRVTAVLRDERRPACPAPPADEVAGLLADLHGLRLEFSDIHTEQLDAIDRLENHLKGKR